MNKLLLIKTGALGDVVRTTPLLHVLDAEVTWVTASNAFPLLRHNPRIARVVDIERADVVSGREYDLVVSLDEDPRAADLATRVMKQALVGVYRAGFGTTYTDSAREWFDMSLISQLGKAKADELKFQNQKTYQEFIFSMIGKAFCGEEYLLPVPVTTRPVPQLVGLEARAGDRWPMKRWNGYEALAAQLEVEGYRVKYLEQRERLEDYIDDINECDYLVCGDTLAMHVGLALRKKVVALFTCTSPQEIYGYGRMTKVVSPMLREDFYSRKPDHGAVNGISVEQVQRIICAWEDEGVAAVRRARDADQRDRRRPVVVEQRET
ncbi:MAG: glycosyltransferase family 9 protein [Candidatus Omnitrophica bacterium]|nr:glycosyltransferase family 9 protein [Candidatus Omnitrophota bacterium]